MPVGWPFGPSPTERSGSAASPHSTQTRRRFLAASVAVGATLAARPAWPYDATRITLRAAPGRVRLVPEPWGESDVWCFGGSVPGPEIRVRRGELLRIEVENALDEPTTVHWHGLRVPNAMDGVPNVTQPPIEPGARFTYEFTPPDAGTFWYHPHLRSAEQVGRGLYGALIVEEEEPPQVDRDIVWVLDDWRLTPEATIAGAFDDFHDASHAGRLGNTVTINGRVPEEFALQPNERIRFRLINAANARIFRLDFGSLAPRIVALDGQPVEPHEPPEGRLTLGPAMRADLILDATGASGERVDIVDDFILREPYRLVTLVHNGEPLRHSPPDWPIRLGTNDLPEPDIDAARRHSVLFTGGMMGAMIERQMGLASGGDMSGMMRGTRGAGVWLVNGAAAEGHLLEPMLTLERDRPHLISMTNATAFHHPIHIHGHSFRVIRRNGTPTAYREWRDTVLMAPRDVVEIAFVADNPGDWMFHCHILEHQSAGMMGFIRIA